MSNGLVDGVGSRVSVDAGVGASNMLLSRACTTQGPFSMALSDVSLMCRECWVSVECRVWVSRSMDSSATQEAACD